MSSGESDWRWNRDGLLSRPGQSIHRIGFAKEFCIQTRAMITIQRWRVELHIGLDYRLDFDGL
jgi:hypothetical protein